MALSRAATLLVVFGVFGQPREPWVVARNPTNPDRHRHLPVRPGAGPFGVPARNAAELSSRLSTPVRSRRRIKPGDSGQPGRDGAARRGRAGEQCGHAVSEPGRERDVDIVIGYVSSGSCLAVAPLAEELKKLTVFFNCGTPRVFEDATYRYVFRTASHATMDGVAAAKYVREKLPDATRIAGINQNYAWGQDSWKDFETSMKVVVQAVHIATSQMPKLFAGQYGAEISTLLGARAQVIHSSLWGGDLEAFILQVGAQKPVREQPRAAHYGRDADSSAPDRGSRRHDHRCARPAQRVRPGQRAQPLVQEHVREALSAPRRHSVPITWSRRSSEPRRRTKRPRQPPTGKLPIGPDRGGIRGSELRNTERHDEDGARQGSSGHPANGVWDDQGGRRQADDDERDALCRRAGQST